MSVGRTIEELLFALKLQQKTKFLRKIENNTLKDILSDLILELINIELFPKPCGHYNFVWEILLDTKHSPFLRTVKRVIEWYHSREMISSLNSRYFKSCYSRKSIIWYYWILNFDF